MLTLIPQQSYPDESLRPVTIKQILDADEAYAGSDFKIDGQAVTQVTFIAQVRSITPNPTNITFKMHDSSGEIEVKKWVDLDKQDEASRLGFEIDSHVRVWGHVKSFSNKRSVNAYVLRKVQDFNEVHYHELEAAYVHLYFTKGPLGAAGGDQNGGGGDSMFVDGGNNDGANAGNMPSKLANVSANGKKVYTFMSTLPGGNQDVHLNVITGSTGMSVRDVLSAADELLGNGLIYPTVDDETWAILDY